MTVPITGRTGAGVIGGERRSDLSSRRLVVDAPKQTDRNLDSKVNHDGHWNGEIEFYAKALLQSEQDGGADQYRDNSTDRLSVHLRRPLAFGFSIVSPAHILPRIDAGGSGLHVDVFAHGVVLFINLLGFLFLSRVFIDEGVVGPLWILGEGRPGDDGQQQDCDDALCHGGYLLNSLPERLSCRPHALNAMKLLRIRPVRQL